MLLYSGVAGEDSGDDVEDGEDIDDEDEDVNDDDDGDDSIDGNVLCSEWLSGFKCDACDSSLNVRCST